MTQPSFVPIAEADQVRPARRLQVPGPWSPDRPADLRGPGQPRGPRHGTPGPDQGFALRLAQRFDDALHRGAAEDAQDVTVGGALIASRRAALFGRAPCIHDLRHAFTLFGFLDPDAPGALVAERERLFRSVARDYVAQRALVDRVPEQTLRLTPEETAARLAQWPTLLEPPSPSP
jgi:hypothetical protein